MVNRKHTAGRPGVRLAVAALLFLTLQGTVTSCSTSGSAEYGERETREAKTHMGMRAAAGRELAAMLKEKIYDTYMPALSFGQSGGHETHWLLQGQVDALMPIYGYVEKGAKEWEDNDAISFREVLLAEAQEGMTEPGESEAESQKSENGGEKDGVDFRQSQENYKGMNQTLEELLRAENEAALEMQRPLFVPHEIQIRIDMSVLDEYEALVKQFYTVDANTMIGSDQLNAAAFLAKDMTVSKDSPGPQILIFHTHSQESFADSVPGDSSTSIIGVGDRLAEILTDTYGYSVLHHTAAYDAETRDDAYSRALPGVEQVLKENPSIQVVIDLHRDQMPADTRLVMDLDGRPTARFMFFNGLSRTRKTGNIAYLYNENLENNLAFSFQMQLAAAEYYPGLTRKIYLKGYRYNMHLKDKYLLVELGAQNNTVEEAMNACDPLAHILDMVLSK